MYYILCIMFSALDPPRSRTLGNVMHTYLWIKHFQNGAAARSNLFEHPIFTKFDTLVFKYNN